MEKRKIIKFGKSSYIITLPLNFIKNNKLDENCEVYLQESDDHIKITNRETPLEKNAIVKLDNQSFKLLNRQIMSYYLKNYSQIRIEGKNVVDKLQEIKILKEKLSSIEIVEITNDSIVLKDLSSPKNLDVLVLLDEIIEMEKLLFAQMLNINKENKFYLIQDLDFNINKLTFLTIKTINWNLYCGNNSCQIKNSIHYWRIVTALEHIGDILKRLSRYMKDAKEENNSLILHCLTEVKLYYDFITSLINNKLNISKNLMLHLDKKQSLLKTFEELKNNNLENKHFYLLVSQLLKDIVGQLDNVVVSILDLNTK